MALNKLDKHVLDQKLPYPEARPRSDRQVRSVEPEARSHPRPGLREEQESKGATRLVPADEEERSEEAIAGARGRKVPDDEA